MRFLLDTHTLIWLWLEDEQLPSTVVDTVSDGRNDVAVPTVCAWEISNKVRGGKLPQMADHVAQYDELVAAARFRHLDLRFDHALRAGLLPGAHRDPFDRLIAGQALVEDMVLVTRDPQFAAFGCRTLW